MTKEKEGHDPDDDFGGISPGAAAFVLIVTALGHPWQALKELLTVVRQLGRKALRLALTPFAFVAAILWLRRRDRYPTFEDYLRRSDEERDRP